MVAYLNACLQENDPALVSHALGIIAKAKGLSQVSIFDVCNVLGVKLHVESV
jgi:DNA-binding phage protein